ncbi:hypothetical protein HDV01_003629 [Terramyces sp. JEL0728]|nr:hypothetical protein HDV01_003629 [Terramyces sp. JEL0728]
MKFLSLAGLALAGANDDGSACYIGNCWNNHTELVNWQLSNSTGGPVWADDGSMGITFELQYERKLEIPPLDVYWRTRKFHYRLVTQPIGGKKQYLTALQKGRPEYDILYFMKSAGYAIVKIYNEETFQMEDYKVGLDGSFTALRSGLYVPSPDGKLLSALNCDVGYCNLTFTEAQTLTAVGNQFSLNLTEARSVRWTSQENIEISDLGQDSYLVNPFGSATSISIPTCFGTATTSSKINANGDVLGIKKDWLLNENLAIIGKAAVSQKFDCK